MKIKTRLGLYVNEQNKDGFYHVTATVVTIGTNAWERRCIDDGSYSYPDIKTDTIRNANDRSTNRLYLENLTIRSQGNNDDPSRHLYGWEVCYQQPYTVDLDKASAMVKTLGTIHRRLQKLIDKYGNATTFGTYLARIASAIGADTIIRPDGKPYGWSYSESTHRMLTIADGVYSVDSSIRSWVTEREKETARATA